MESTNDGSNLLHGHITQAILVDFFAVYNELGFGFLESVYRVALQRALQQKGLHVQRDWPVDVYFRSAVVGRFQADLVVEDCVVVEAKAVRTILPEHRAQLLHYLKATRMEVGLLLNFGRNPEFQRLIFTQRGAAAADGTMTKALVSDRFHGSQP
jgi:GxxExxY protein